MDKIKGLAEKASGNKSSEGSSTGGAAGKQDYGDKAFAAGEKQFGVKSDPKRDEMITDKSRDFIEKESGKNIPDKFSN